MPEAAAIAQPAAVPSFGLVDAPDHWRAIDFISDLHLSESHPKTFNAWREFLEGTSADAVFLLGDVFEAWIGDDSRHQGFARDCAEVLKQASARLSLSFMAGNRDFLVGDELLQSCGVRHLQDPTLLNAWGHRIVLTHGDALCLSDQPYQRFRSQVRNPAWQQAFLSRPLDERRQIAKGMRDTSQAMKSGQAVEDWVDLDLPAVLAWLQAARATVMVHGHTHRPGTQKISSTATRHVLSDWDFEAEVPRSDVLRLTPDGFARLPVHDAADGLHIGIKRPVIDRPI